MGAASRMALADASSAIQQAISRGTEDSAELSALAASLQRRSEHASRYVEAYRRYCWPVSSIDDLALAPFQILASEGGVHLDRDHRWQMETLAELSRADAANDARPLLRATAHRVVDLATAWRRPRRRPGGRR